MKMLRTPFLAAALFAGAAAVGLAPSFAQTAPNAANSAAPAAANHHGQSRLTPGQLVDGRIAFLKAELKITPEQEAPWQQMAAAMRQNATALDQAVADARQHRGDADAIERLTMRGQFAKVQADNDARLLDALKPLYATLSPEQQQMANRLLASDHGWRHGSHHRA